MVVVVFPVAVGGVRLRRHNSRIGADRQGRTGGGGQEGGVATPRTPGAGARRQTAIRKCRTVVVVVTGLVHDGSWATDFLRSAAAT